MIVMIVEIMVDIYFAIYLLGFTTHLIKSMRKFNPSNVKRIIDAIIVLFFIIVTVLFYCSHGFTELIASLSLSQNDWHSSLVLNTQPFSMQSLI